MSGASPLVAGDVDYRALLSAVEAMSPDQFLDTDLDALARQFAKRR